MNHIKLLPHAGIAMMIIWIIYSQVDELFRSLRMRSQYISDTECEIYLLNIDLTNRT